MLSDMKESWQKPRRSWTDVRWATAIMQEDPTFNAVILSCQAVMEYAQRYAALAGKNGC